MLYRSGEVCCVGDWPDARESSKMDSGCEDVTVVLDIGGVTVAGYNLKLRLECDCALGMLVLAGLKACEDSVSYRDLIDAGFVRQ